MLSVRIQDITPSATVELDTAVREMKAAGVDVVSLNIGEPDYKTPENIRNACKQALDACKTTYVAIAGIIELRSAIAEKLQRDNHVTYSTDQICVSTGAKQALFNAVYAVAGAGDEVIVLTPSWVSYVEIVKLAGAVPVCVPTDKEYQPDIEKIRAAVTERTKAIIINTPNNPTGAVYSREVLEEIVSLAVEHDIMIIADEVYEKYVYNGKKHICVAELSRQAYEHCILINGCSKAYCMTGWRVGYSAAPIAYAKAIRSLQGHVTSNSTSFAQYGAVEALKNGECQVKKMIAEFEKRQAYVMERLHAMPNITCSCANGAFYLFPDVSWYYNHQYGNYTIKDSFDFCSFMLKEKKVAIVPGGAFEAPDNIRISYTNSMEQIKLGLDRFEEGLIQLGESGTV